MNKYKFFKLPKIKAEIKAERRRLGLPPLKPLHTFAEIAEILGVDRSRLQSLVRDPSAPRYEDIKSSSHGLKYYDADKFKKWWEGLSKEKKT